MIMISIIIASILVFIFGAVWYSSPIGTAWNKAKLTDPEGKKYVEGKSYMIKMFAMGFAIIVVLVYTLDVFFQVFGAETLSEHLQLAMLICFGFIVTSRFNDLIYTSTPPFWGKRAQTVFLVDSAYYIVAITIMTLVLYWF